VVLWRLRYKLSLRDLAELFLTRGFVFTYEAGAGVGGEAHTGSGGEPLAPAQVPGRPQLVYR